MGNYTDSVARANGVFLSPLPDGGGLSDASRSIARVVVRIGAAGNAGTLCGRDTAEAFAQFLAEDAACMAEEQEWNAREEERVAADMVAYGGTPVTDQTCREFVAAQHRMYP
jgi:hypothetical protein